MAPKQQLFVQYYLADMNATAAAKRAGYSKKTAYSIGQRLLKKVEIKEAIAAAQKKLETRLGTTKEKWLKELERIYYARVDDFSEIVEGGGNRIKTFGEMPDEMIGAIESIEENRTIRESADGKESMIVNDKLKLKLHSKIEAGKLIGQHLGYIKDKLDIHGLPELGAALYELSDKFLPTARGKKARTRSDG